MEIVHKTETQLADVHKKLPHLPKGLTKWLAENAWWLVLIGVVLSLLALPAIFAAIGLASGLASYAAIYTTTQLGASLTALWVSVGFLIAIVAIEAMAISPLKGLKKRGWDLLLLATFVSIISSVVNAVITYSPAGLIGAAIGAAIGLYVLFELRGHFTSKKA